MMMSKSSQETNPLRLLEGEVAPWPFFEEEVISKVSSVLRSGKVNQWGGIHVNLLAEEFAAYLEHDKKLYAIPNSNGSTALQMALHACDITENDEVIVSPRSFIISASCPLLCKATPVFADVDSNGNMDADGILSCLTSRTKAVIIVHMGGLACNMPAIVELCRSKNIFLIEDCSQAHGGKYNNQHLGTFGDVGTWSFCQDKIITTGGEGGICITSNEKLFRKMWGYKDHGRDYNLCTDKNIKWKPGYRRLCTSIGTNYRMTEMQAVIGRHFLTKLDEWITIRKRNAKILIDKLESLSMARFPKFEDTIIDHAYYRVYMFVDSNFMSSKNITNVDICEAVKARGVPCSVGSCATLWQEPCFNTPSDKIMYLNPSGCPRAKILFSEQVAFVCHPTISGKCMDKMACIVKDVLLSL
jgi:dTDP-4-amino-4,6-dideoxygalactose transaminase